MNGKKLVQSTPVSSSSKQKMTWTSIHKFRRLFSNEFRKPSIFPSLPTDYVAFLSDFNGIEFESTLVIDFGSGMSKVPEEPYEDCVELSVLYGCCNDQQDNLLDLVRAQQDYWFSDWNEGKLVAIGGTHSFNELCLSIRPQDFGAVYWWPIPSEPPNEIDLIGDRWRDYRLEKLANSFTEFWAKIDLFAVARNP